MKTEFQESPVFRVGTRGSQLALKQCEIVCQALNLKAPHALSLEVCPIKTSGDLRQGTREEKVPDKKAWVQEIEDKILSQEIDFAVHSSKDVPIEIASETVLIPVLARDYPEDVVILKSGARLLRSMEEFGYFLDEEARMGLENFSVGTSSLRRGAQIRRLYPGVSVEDVRGNVNTRLGKLENSASLLGLVLARAGLMRLGLSVPHFVLPVERFLPAVNQGIIVAQCLKGARVRHLLQRLSEPDVVASWVAERAFIAQLGADCHSAVGVYCKVQNEQISIKAGLWDRQGRREMIAEHETSASRPEDAGRALALRLLDDGAEELLF